MSATNRWHPVTRIGLAVVLAALAWLAARWLLAPEPMCFLPPGADASYTCPNRLGLSLPTAVSQGLAALGAFAAGITTWNATAGPAPAGAATGSEPAED